jgi:hypothetical protein
LAVGDGSWGSGVGVAVGANAVYQQYGVVLYSVEQFEGGHGNSSRLTPKYKEETANTIFTLFTIL